MIHFTATIQQFAEQGEKTGWMYITVPQDLAEQLMPGTKKSFRVKGKLDAHPIAGVALVPIGGGNYIIAFNAAMRKGTRKKRGAMIKVQLSYDPAPIPTPPGFIESLEDEPEAKAYFDQLKLSQRNYFLKWMLAVKSEDAVAKRIAQVIKACQLQQDFGEMIRGMKGSR